MATKNTKSEVTTSVVIAERDANLFNNEDSRKAKESVKEFFGNYEKQLKLQWDGLKHEDTAFKALNAVIAGIAGGIGEKPEIWLIKNFSKFVTEDLKPCNKHKDANGNVFFKLANLSGSTARGLLKKCALNCIESERIGNRFKQTFVTPITK